MSADPLSEVTVPEPVREGVRDYYYRYEEFYAEPWADLDATRRLFESTDLEHAGSLLVLSYVYAVISQRVNIDAAERHFRRVYDGERLDDVMLVENNINGKADYVYGTLDTYGRDGMGRLADRIASGAVEQAVREMDDTSEFKYIAAVKAPFIAAQLGYTSQMCVDANVQSFLGIDLADYNLGTEAMSRVCADVMDLFPMLAEEVAEPYHLQWILFNYERVHNVAWDPAAGDLTLSLTGAVASERIEGREPEAHDEWFRATLDDRDRVVERVEDLYAEARGPR